MMLSVPALIVSILSACAESIKLSALPAESMILSAPTDKTRKHTGMVHWCINYASCLKIANK
jgi:hypothetical protein